MTESIEVFRKEKKDRLRPGDRFIYDQKGGCISVYRVDGDEGDVRLQSGGEGPTPRLFVGLSWSQDQVRAAAELTINSAQEPPPALDSERLSRLREKLGYQI